MVSRSRSRPTHADWSASAVAAGSSAVSLRRYSSASIPRQTPPTYVLCKPLSSQISRALHPNYELASIAELADVAVRAGPARGMQRGAARRGGAHLPKLNAVAPPPSAVNPSLRSARREASPAPPPGAKSRPTPPPGAESRQASRGAAATSRARPTRRGRRRDPHVSASRVACLPTLTPSPRPVRYSTSEPAAAGLPPTVLPAAGWRGRQVSLPPHPSAPQRRTNSVASGKAFSCGGPPLSRAVLHSALRPTYACVTALCAGLAKWEHLENAA
ncbi:mucin-7-like [Schistocerca cancellata]|uniref:mucin-7-like n=1 Tax=Schistocerca cancellata TaxID=274614 RepID=UPI0021198F07|nr:mucin-7-like [Schistocerca cancellata]